ncbi:hypothetical protein NX794_10040 [Streptomyces sp. LP11]|uniref:Holin n=1 Tax=Streptomyces pyxinicus TaxID=2970331 RepID=A0ABT2B0B0_9ACTN|nr:hypothetical protein [Streptomyces sp. LP11]MCS0601560.1 hypothetical protein [Streptomyces sp. LP11]
MGSSRVGGADETALEKDRARYGLLAVVVSNLAVVAVAVFGVWQLDGDKAVIVGVLTAAFTAVSSTTTAYLGIKAVSNTARSIALADGPSRAHTPVPEVPPAVTPVASASRGA